jgi:hypothetical protein
MHVVVQAVSADFCESSHFIVQPGSLHAWAQVACSALAMAAQLAAAAVHAARPGHAPPAPLALVETPPPPPSA